MTKDVSATEDDNWYADGTATFGDRLAAAREAVGLSQKELAERIGVSKKVISDWENDMKEPRANRLQMLAGMLNVSLMWILTGEGEGLTAPDAGGKLSRPAVELLAELREVRTEIGVMSERLGRLESRLRLEIAREAA